MNTIIVAGYRSAGFLAYLTSSVPGSTYTPIPFDLEEYDYGDNYDPSTGIYTVPLDGLYLIHARVYGKNNDADHFIRVDGSIVTYTKRTDPDESFQHASTTIVLHLLAGQQVAVDPDFYNNVWGNKASSFGAALLYPD